MRSKLIKTLSLLLSLALFTGVASGCSGSSKNPSGATPGTSQQTAAVKVDVVKLWLTEGGAKDVVTPMIEEFNNTVGKQKGIQIEYKVDTSPDYTKVLDLAIASGQSPDLFRASSPISVDVQKGYLTAIEDMPGGKDFLKGYEKYIVPAINMLNGKTYSVPFNLTTIGLLYNKDLFKKAGIVDAKGEAKPPKTWAEMAEYAKKITNPAEKTYGIALAMKWKGFYNWEIIDTFVSSVGHHYFDYKEGIFKHSDFKPAFEWLMKIKEDKSYFPGPEGLDNDPARAQFAEGRIGMKFGASYDVGVLNDQFPAKCDWGVADVPVLDPGNKYKQFSTMGSYCAISSSSKDRNKEKIMEVFKFVNSDEFLTKLYEECKYIPYKVEIAQKAKKEPAKKGWKEFSQLVGKSYMYSGNVSPKVEGEDAYAVMMKIWFGAVSINQGLADLDKRYNEALQKDVAAGTIDLKTVLDPKFDIRLK